MAISENDLTLVAHTVRTLSMDAVQRANSGHPGMPMGCADIAAVLWTRIMKYNPHDPQWINRDRFVLSAGHGSMLLYSMLHLSGYDLSMDDIKNFRQLGSKTPGHPEYGHTVGVETTTGPLGQGFANGVGMAFASKFLGKEFNGESNIIDHYIYAIAGDGCIMEGISSEAASLAGHWQLGNLIYIYDSNRITIEGDTDITFSEDVKGRFEAYNWHVLEIDGHNFDEIEEAIFAGQNEKTKPTLIIAKTNIAKGSAGLEGSADSHGAPLGEDDIRKSKELMGCAGDESFFVNARVYEIFEEVRETNLGEYSKWRELFDSSVTGDLKSKWESFFTTPDVEELRKVLPKFPLGETVATRGASGKVIEALYNNFPNFVGGSADLGPSNKTIVGGVETTGHGKIGRSIHYGVREHAMGAIQNGMTVYGGCLTFSATFLVFMDYMRPAIRMAALSGLPSVYVFTHDSLFVGEDGPTHQPVEHLAIARAIPNLNVIRPCDGEETREAWISALTRTDGPTMLVLSRQGLPGIDRIKSEEVENLHRGAYVIFGFQNPDGIIFASGSEVSIAIEASTRLYREFDKKVRVVSFPSWELFDSQPEEYRKTIMVHGVKKIVVEAGLSMGWERYSGKDALFITMEGFGCSAPQADLEEKFGFNVESLMQRILEYLG